MSKYEKILHVALVRYFLLLQKVDEHGIGWSDEFKLDGFDIFDELICKYAALQKEKLDKGE